MGALPVQNHLCTSHPPPAPLLVVRNSAAVCVMFAAAVRSRAVGVLRTTLRSASPSLSFVFAGARRSLFIQTEETPNPSSLKYIPGRTVYDSHLITRANALAKETSDPDLKPPDNSLWGPMDPPAAPAADETPQNEDLPTRQGYYVTPTDTAAMRQSPLGRRLLRASDR